MLTGLLGRIRAHARTSIGIGAAVLPLAALLVLAGASAAAEDAGASAPAAAVAATTTTPTATTTPATTAPAFHAVILPILADHCFECHSDRKQKARLRLDSRAAMLRGGKSGPALIPGDAGTSLIMQAVRYDNPDLQMPPDAPLTATQVTALAAWIAAGAPWDDPPTAATSAAPPTGQGPTSAAPPTVSDAPHPEHHRPPLIGRVHPLVVHFPIACLLLAVLAEFLVITLGPRWDPVVRFLMVIGTLSAIVAVTTGTWFADQGTMFHRSDVVLTRHEVVGWTTMLLALAGSGCLFASHRPRLRLVFRLLLLVTAASAGLTGHLGGTMVYGEHFLF